MGTTPTPTDRAEAYKTELIGRLSQALKAVSGFLQHDDKEARQTAGACRLMLVGALTDSEVVTVQAWTYVRGHVSDCLHDDTRGKEAREVYRAILSLLDGK